MNETPTPPTPGRGRPRRRWALRLGITAMGTGAVVASLATTSLGATSAAGAPVGVPLAHAPVDAVHGRMAPARLVGTSASAASPAVSARAAHFLTISSAPRHPIASSYNWSGFAGHTSGGQGIEAEWVVPAVAPSPTRQFGSAWIGVDGLTSSDPTILQAGTEQDSSGSDYIWEELYPQPSACLSNAAGNNCFVVHAGDLIKAAIWPVAAKRWDVSIVDVTQHDFGGTGTVTYTGPATSAEWIVEAPTDGSTGQILPLDNYSAIGFSGASLLTNAGRTASAPTLTGTGIEMLNTGGQSISFPGVPSRVGSGDRFTVFRVTQPGAPTSVAASPRPGAVAVTWKAPTSAGHSVVDGYRVRVYQGGILVQTVATTGSATSTTVTGLTPGTAYRFSVATTTVAGWTSAFSPETPAVAPAG